MSGHEGARHWQPEEDAETVLVGVDGSTVPVAFPVDQTAPMDLTTPMSNPGELLRFGPGVPVPEAALDMGQAAVIWRGETPPPSDDTGRRRRRLASWLLPLLVLLAVLAILLWQRSGSPLTVTGAVVHTAAPRLTCDETATLTAAMYTNGASGTISYRWRRSDGTVSDTLRQQVAKGSNTVRVVLLWSFHGQGTFNAKATLEVLGPNQVSAFATFTYACS